jgi:hypothetical protein
MTRCGAKCEIVRGVGMHRWTDHRGRNYDEDGGGQREHDVQWRESVREWIVGICCYLVVGGGGGVMRG